MRGDAGPDRIWIEFKAIFESVLLKTAQLVVGDRTYLRDYTGDLFSTAANKAAPQISIEQARVDAEKVSCIGPAHSEYVGLLLLEFDHRDYEIQSRADYGPLVNYLQTNGWIQICRESWSDKVNLRNQKGYQEHVVFWIRKT